MPKMKSHSGLKKRVMKTKSGKLKRHKKGVKHSVAVSSADSYTINRRVVN